MLFSCLQMLSCILLSVEKKINERMGGKGNRDINLKREAFGQKIATADSVTKTCLVPTLSAQHRGQSYIIFSTFISSRAACQLDRFLERVGEREWFDSQTAVFTAHPMATAFPSLGVYLYSLPDSSVRITLI